VTAVINEYCVKFAALCSKIKMLFVIDVSNVSIQNMVVYVGNCHFVASLVLNHLEIRCNIYCSYSFTFLQKLVCMRVIDDSVELSGLNQ